MLDKQKNQGVLQPYLRNVNVRWGKFDLSDLLQMPFEDNEDERYSICQNDLVVCEGGEPGRCAIWTAIDPIKFQKALHRVRCCKGIHNKYIQIILKTFSANGMIERYYTGSTIKHLTGDSLNSIQFPLPPTKEQTRIVDEVERWENVMDILIKEGEELSSVILQTKCRILNLALQGKLVSQDPNDEPAVELLKRINPKFEPCDNAHYGNVPIGWQFIELGKVCQLTEGVLKEETELPYLDVKAMRTRQVVRKTNGKYVEIGTMLILVDGENSGEIFKTKTAGYQGSTMKVLEIDRNMNEEYVLQFIKLFKKALKENKVGSAIPHLNKKMFRELVIPIPPRNEQTRIVSAIQQYENILDSISANL